jgi:amino acid transporter
MTIVCGFSMGQGCMVAASRVTYAYARDDVFPGSKWLKIVNSRTRTPVNAVWFNAFVGILLTLLLFGGVAIDAIFSIGAIAAFVAFTIPITIRTFFVGDRFRRGPWHLGKWSYPNGVLATCFTVLMIPIMCFPSVTGADLDAETMNWTALVWGGPMLIVMVWWFVSARKWFTGPKVNIEHMMLGREGNLIDGTVQPKDAADGRSSDEDASSGTDKAAEKAGKVV